MKKLLIYSSNQSIHTQSILKYLSTNWHTQILTSPTNEQLIDSDIDKFRAISENIEVRSDNEFAPKPKEFILKNPFQISLDLIRSRNQIKRIINFRRKAVSVNQILKKLNPDLIFAHQLQYSLITYLSKFKPYAISFWGSDIYRDSKQFKDKKLLKNCLMNAELIHCVNPEQKEIIVKKYEIDPEKIFVQHFGAELENFQPLTNKLSIRKKYGFKEEILILSPRYSPIRKLFKLKLIVKAFKILLDNYPKLIARLVFIHKAETQKDLIQLIKKLDLEKYVTFFGFVTGEKYQDIIRMVDILVQCPLWDGAPITVMESLSAGVPIVTTANIGNEVNVRDGYNGLFIKNLNPEGIAERLATLINNKTLYKTLSENAHEWATQNCNRNEAMDKISNKLKQVISE